MSVSDVAVAILLACAVAVGWLCAVGVLVMRNPFARLHYVGPAATLAPALVAAAVWLHHRSAQGCVKVGVLLVALALINPVLTHVTARAARVRQGAHADMRDSTAGGET